MNEQSKPPPKEEASEVGEQTLQSQPRADLRDVPPSSSTVPTHSPSVGAVGLTVTDVLVAPATAPQPQPNPTDGDRYQPTRYIAQGGSASVSEALDQKLGRQVALKQMHRALAGTEQAIRFQREARITAWLDHPNIAPVHDVIVNEDGLPVLVMKLVRGITLGQRIARSPGDEASLHDLLGSLLKVCDAVAYAHERGVIHRDLKPSNVMVGSHGEVYVMDWGVAKLTPLCPLDLPDPFEADRADASPLTVAGTLVGSPAYMSPEQAWAFSEEISNATDIFGLGTLLYEILTGLPPYAGGTLLAMLEAARSGDVIPPRERAPERQIRPVLERVCMKALSRHKDDRFASARELAEALTSAVRSNDWFELRECQPGEVIIQQGARADAAYLLESGTCVVTRVDAAGNQEVLREMGPGEVFGEAGLLSGQPRSATVMAKDAVVVRCIDRENLKRSSAGSPLGLLAKKLAERFLERERELTGNPVSADGERDDPAG